MLSYYLLSVGAEAQGSRTPASTEPCMAGDQTHDPGLTGLRYAVFLTALPFGILPFALAPAEDG